MLAPNIPQKSMSAVTNPRQPLSSAYRERGKEKKNFCNTTAFNFGIKLVSQLYLQLMTFVGSRRLIGLK